MTEMPEQEEAIFFKLGDKDSSIPAGKTVIEYTLANLRLGMRKGFWLKTLT